MDAKPSRGSAHPLDAGYDQPHLGHVVIYIFQQHVRRQACDLLYSDLACMRDMYLESLPDL